MSTSPLSPDDIRAAAETHAELGPDYRDAVVESFLAKIDKEIGARIDAGLASAPARKHDIDPVTAARRRGLATGLASGLLLGTIGTGLPLTWLAFYAGVNWSGWQPKLWLIWAVIGIVYVAGGAAFLLSNRRSRRQNPRDGGLRGR